VTDWVKVSYNEARYGRSDGYPCPDNVCSSTWSLITDAINAWIDSQKAAGLTPEQIKKELDGFDTWDRNDYDDGNFNEADGDGEGEILPIDSQPQPIYKLDGKPWRGRIQTYDAPFSLEKAGSFTLHDQNTGQASYIRGQAAQPVFDDRRSYWTAAQPAVGVKVRISCTK